MDIPVNFISVDLPKEIKFPFTPDEIRERERERESKRHCHKRINEYGDVAWFIFKKYKISK